MFIYRIGDRVTIGTAGTTIGTVQQRVNDVYYIVRWDDGSLGHVHPDDIRLITN